MAVSAFEKKRLEELFKYFQAASHAIGLADNDVDSEHQYDPALGRVSLDPVLNALCQLGVHRLDCDRAFISLIDHENQYIISEMTKSVSLYDTFRHDPGDGVCMGARPLDLFTGVCAGTMPAFTGGPAPNPHHINTSNMFADQTRYIINDFSLEPKYRDRPYVKGHPHMRYYAEVPITTSQGYVIGTYAVVDNKPRRGLDEQSFLALNEIATSIMRYIEMVKVQDDYAQSSRLLQGLNSLVQDGHCRITLPGSDAISKLTSRNRTSPPAEKHLSQVSPAPEVYKIDSAAVLKHSRPDFLTSDSRSNTMDRSYSSTASPPLASIPISKKGDSPSNASHATEHLPVEAEPQKVRDMEILADLKSFNASADVHNIFDVAAESLRIAMDLESVLFLDASTSQMTSHGRERFPSRQAAPGSLQSVLNGSPTIEGQFHPTSSTSSTPQNTTELPNPGIEASTTRRANSKLLGAAKKARSNHAGDTISPPFCEVSDSLHQNLLRRYPNGYVFNLGLRELPEDASIIYPTSDLGEGSIHLSHQALSYQEILDQIRFAFPYAKSVIFFPLWHNAKRSWFAGCLGWSSHEKRVLQHQDLAYLNIFGNSLMAKVARLDLIATDHAKSDFISNISHELRSPLHGILGSTELLQGLVQDADQQQMIAMVEQCGRTLLDTMNSVYVDASDIRDVADRTSRLDYSKINRIAQDNKGQRVTEALSSGVEPKAFRRNLSTFDLSSLVEEAVESLLAGHQHSSRARTQACFSRAEDGPVRSPTQEEERPKQSPIVILDISHRATWLIESDAASWRRCVLNLLGNALKYTDVGFVEVVVRCDTGYPKTTGAVTLLIRDTGRGIGKAYLENHLFRPFLQEDALSSGVGLGLSIVKSLVHGMGGWLEVQSEVGIGTQVEVSIPVNFVSSPAVGEQVLLAQQPIFTATFAGFEAFTLDGKSQNKRLSTSQMRTLTLNRAVWAHLVDWLKVKVSSSTSTDRSILDIIVVEEQNLHLFNNNKPDEPPNFQLPAKSILLILCTQHDMQYHSMQSNTDPVYYLSQPFGPRRLASLVSRLIRSRNSEELIPPAITKPAHEQPPDVSQVHVQMPILSDRQKTFLTTSTAERSVASPSTAATLYMPHVLLVDDNDVNLALLTQCMRQQKVRYRTARNGAEALEAYKIAEPPFGLVFMDISMPVMDGFAATRAIRHFERSSGRAATKIIAMTGLGSAKAQQEGFSSGMDIYLIKPVQLKKVRSLIQEMSTTSAAVGRNSVT